MSGKTMAEVICDAFNVDNIGVLATPEQIETALAAAGYYHIGSYHHDDQGEH